MLTVSTVRSDNLRLSKLTVTNQLTVTGTMSEKHLQTGDPLPQLKDGSIRLYSMKYCPFAHRPRLVLHAKGIEYEEININLKKKPEFLFEKNSEGKVPVFEHNDQIIPDSSIICHLVDDLYPDPPLYPGDPFKKAKDKIVIETFGSKVIPVFYQALRSKGQDEEAISKLMDALTKFEADLQKRGTQFFGGEQPGMLDYITWPFNERIMVVDFLFEKVKAKLPDLAAYYQRMSETPAVKAVMNSKEMHLKYLEGYLSGNDQYDL